MFGCQNLINLGNGGGEMIFHKKSVQWKQLNIEFLDLEYYPSDLCGPEAIKNRSHGYKNIYILRNPQIILFLLRFDNIKPNLFKSVEKTKSTALHFNVAAHMAFLEAVCFEQVQALN